VGNYRVERELAEGGMGTVYVATHTVLPRRAAIKVLRSELSRTALARDGLVREACVIESMHDPRVALLYDAGELPDGRPWFAMELIEGECLADRLARRAQLSLDEAAQLICALADALAAAHLREVVHGDVKPENIMVCEGTPMCVRLIDWGISHTRRGAGAGQSLAIGTPHYMAPEQIRGEPLDARADLYALGVLAYEVLAGQPPFVGDDPSRIATQHLHRKAPAVREARPEIPPAIDALISAMLRKERSERPSLEAVRAGFALVLESALVRTECGPRNVGGAPEEDFQLVIEIDYTACSERDTLTDDLEDLVTAGTDCAQGPVARTRWTPQAKPLSARPTLRLGRVVSSDNKVAACTSGVIRERPRS